MQVALWAMYVIAQLLHVLVKANQSAANPRTPWNSIREYFASFWPALVMRWVLGTAIFWLWWDRSSFVAGAAPLLALPLNYGTALIYGWFSDSVLDKVLSLIQLKAD